MGKNVVGTGTLGRAPLHWRRLAFGLVAVLGGSVLLAYCWRVMFGLGHAIALLPLAGAVCAIALPVYTLFMLSSVWASDKFCFKVALFIFIVGLLFVFATAPMQAPDEEAHYLRAYAMSQGIFTYDYNRVYTGDVAWLMQATGTTAGLGNAVRYEAHELAPTVIAQYLQGVASGGAATPVGEPIMQMLLPFVPQALCMALARLFGFGALGLMYAGRIGNLLAYTVLCYFALRNCQRYRGVFIAVMLLPLSLFLAASCNYDGTMLGACFLLLSYFCKKEISSRDIVVFAVCAVYITYVKLNNIFLIPVLLMIPKARWKTRWHPWAAAGIMVLAALFVYYVLGANLIDGGLLLQNATELPRGIETENVQPAAQLMFVIKNLPAFVARLLWAVYEDAAYVFQLGVLGKLDLELPLVSGLSVLSLAAASALGIQQKEDTPRGSTIALGLAAFLYAVSVLGAMYILNTALYSIRITGVQPRYFLPAILLFFMFCSILLGKAVRPRLALGTQARAETITLYIALAIALLAALCLFQSYYVGQWLPKAEGGYKMVNILGWQQT